MKKQKGKLVILVLFVFASMTCLHAQESDTSVDVGIDLVSRYVWRGMNLSTSPAMQPYLEFYLGDFTIGTWGSYSLSQEPYQEVDLYLNYTVKGISFTLYDYFNPVDTLFTTHNYFDWNKHTTSHALEAVLEIQETDSWPVSLAAAVMVYGNDLDDAGNNYYSTYLEAGYHFSVGQQPIRSFIGITPAEGLYSDGFNLVNMGLSLTKEIAVTDQFSLPLSAAFSINPDTESVFFVVGISIL